MSNNNDWIKEVLGLVIDLNSSKVHNRYFFEFRGHVNWVTVMRKFRNNETKYLCFGKGGIEWGNSHSHSQFDCKYDFRDVISFLANELVADEIIEEEVFQLKLSREQYDKLLHDPIYNIKSK